MVKLLKTIFYNYKNNCGSGIITMTSLGANYMFYITKTIWKIKQTEKKNMKK